MGHDDQPCKPITGTDFPQFVVASPRKLDGLGVISLENFGETFIRGEVSFLGTVAVVLKHCTSITKSHCVLRMLHWKGPKKREEYRKIPQLRTSTKPREAFIRKSREKKTPRSSLFTPTKEGSITFVCRNLFTASAPDQRWLTQLRTWNCRKKIHSTRTLNNGVHTTSQTLSFFTVIVRKFCDRCEGKKSPSGSHRGVLVTFRI